LEIPDELAGQTIECPSCNASLAVPPPAPAQVQESAPQAASSKKSKLSIPKWAIASVAGIAVVVVGLIMFFPDDSNGVLPSEPTAVKTDGESQQSASTPEAKPEPQTAKAPDIDIHSAATEGNIEAVKQHLAAGTDLNAKDDDGWTPLDWAIDLNRTEIVDLLRKHGGKTKGWLEAGDSIHIAAGAGHIEAVKQHLVDGANVNARRDTGDTPLHVAALVGRKEVAELLITEDADVNAKILSGVLKGKTPLDFAIRRHPVLNRQGNHSETADLLRTHGGKTGEELKGGEPVAEAAQPEPPTAKAPDISILDAAWDGNIEAVKQHLAAGTDVNAKDSSKALFFSGSDDRTPLHNAATFGHKEIVELLIAKGADVNAKTAGRVTPLHNAAFGGYKEIAELVIAEGADVNAKSEGGHTPLDYAIRRKHPETADLLRKHGGKTGEELKAEGK